MNITVRPVTIKTMSPAKRLVTIRIKIFIAAKYTRECDRICKSSAGTRSEYHLKSIDFEGFLQDTIIGLGPPQSLAISVRIVLQPEKCYFAAIADPAVFNSAVNSDDGRPIRIGM